MCVCLRVVFFFFFSPKLKFGIHSGVIGGLERATEPPPRCLSCHVGGVDLVILWESKVPLTAVWGVIHRAAHEEGRGGGGSHIVYSATYELGWSWILWLSVNCLYRHKDNFARGHSIFKHATLPVTTSQALIIPPTQTTECTFLQSLPQLG